MYCKEQGLLFLRMFTLLCQGCVVTKNVPLVYLKSTVHLVHNYVEEVVRIFKSPTDTTRTWN